MISLGAQGIPLGGFEPTPLNTGAGAGVASSLGAGTLSSVYDPAIQETQIATALAVFDANFTTSILWGHSTTPINNSHLGRRRQRRRPGIPLVFNQDNATFQSTLQKRAATGAVLQIQHNVSYLYSNSPANVFPSAYTTNTQLSITQPLLGGTAQNPSGLEANRANIVIARLNADASVWNFKAAIMAHVRSIEQQYWSLSQQQIALWSRETAVKLGEEILRRERAELEVGRATTADVAEAEQQLENFKLNLVTRHLGRHHHRAAAPEHPRPAPGRQPPDRPRHRAHRGPARARLGDQPGPDARLPARHRPAAAPGPADRAPAPAGPEPAPPAVEPERPLPVQRPGPPARPGRGGHRRGGPARASTRSPSAKNPPPGVNTQPQDYKDFNQWQVGLTFSMPIGFRAPLANTRQAQYQLLRQRAFLQQIVHQTTHSLARFFLEVDANYKQFRTAQRLRAAAQQRLEAQRAFYEEGRITIDRLLDAVSQYANAIAQEAQYKTSYNTSIAALEEAKGTLLAYDNIAVAEGPSPRKAYIQAKDQRAGHGQFHVPLDGSYRPQPINGPPLPDTLPDEPAARRRATTGPRPPSRPRSAPSAPRRPRRPRRSRPASPTSSRRTGACPGPPPTPASPRPPAPAPEPGGHRPRPGPARSPLRRPARRSRRSPR